MALLRTNEVLLPRSIEKPKLKLVKPPPKGSSDQALRIVAVFLALSLLVIAVLIYLSFQKPPDFEATFKTFGQLHDVYRKEGMSRFLEQKELLRKTIIQSLRSETDSPEQDAATSIAVYLFPEVLPAENFEKDVGVERWASLQKDIESSPRSAESRLKFEELRANIWNYESPDRDAPQLSPQAKQVIRIYEVLSAP